jgi:hypothetical protein
MTSSTTRPGGAGMIDFSRRSSAKNAESHGELAVIEKVVAAGLFLALILLKLFYAVNQPWNSDETQHLHVVWAWANGMLPYKDVFDNHAPLFQALSAPVFAWFGERADIVTIMRWAITPIAMLILALTYRLGSRLFSKRVGLWGAVLAASFPDLYAKLGEYRPDLFWSAVWLILLTILTGGRLSPRRLFWAGFVLGIAFAVSMKTLFLLLTILLAAVVAGTIRRIDPGLRRSSKNAFSPLRVVAPVAGALVVPLVVVAFFAWKGALTEMFYGVVIHNITASGDQWSLFFHRMRDWRFWLFVPMIAGGILLARGDPDRRRGIQRLFLMSATGLYCPLLFGFWPLISKQDFLPFFPIFILVLTYPLLWIGQWLASRTRLAAYWLPALLAVSQLGWMISSRPPFKPANQANFAIISDVLKLTRPGETVFDAKGQTIYRPRPFYYVFEQITREKFERGELRDDAPERLKAEKTPVVVSSHWLSPATGSFVSENYIPVGSVLVLGKKLVPAEGGQVDFEIAIPARYAIVGANGLATGTLDGVKLLGPRDLSPGRHDLVLTSVSGPVFVIWSRALEKGFSPLGQAS